jgi:hypothetical protein
MPGRLSHRVQAGTKRRASARRALGRQPNVGTNVGTDRRFVACS